MRAALRRVQRWRDGLGAALLCLVCAAFFAAPAEIDAKSRDSDASRMQARQISFPSSHADALSPPSDRIDWRYFKLAKSTRVSLTADFDTSGNGGRIVLTSATGHEIASGAASSGTARIAQELEPGLYYVSVEASGATSYNLSVE